MRFEGHTGLVEFELLPKSRMLQGGVRWTETPERS